MTVLDLDMALGTPFYAAEDDIVIP